MVPPIGGVIAALVRAFEIDVLTVEYLRLLAINVIACLAVWMFARAMFRDTCTAIVSVAVLVGGGLGAYGLGWYWHLGSWAEWHPLANAVGIFVLAAIYAGRFVTAGAILGALLWIHPAHAAILGVLTAVALLVDVRAGWRTALTTVAVGAAVGAPALWQLVERLPILGASAPDLDDWWRLMRARKSHHLFPLSWSWRTWGAAGTIVAGGLLARWAVRRTESSSGSGSARERLSTALLLALTGICAIGIVFSELRPNVLVTKLGLLRASIYLEIILAVYVCRIVTLLVATGRIALPLAGLVLAVGMVWIDVFSRPGRVALILCPLLALLWPPRAGPPVPGRRQVIMALAVLAVAVLPHVWLQALPSRVSHPLPLLQAWKDVQTWARDHTGPETTFVTPPNWCGFTSFAQRPGSLSVCDVGLSVYATQWASEEIERMNVYRRPEDADAIVPGVFLDGWDVPADRIPAEILHRIARATRAQYIVVTQPTRLTLPRAYENPGFVVFRTEGGG